MTGDHTEQLQWEILLSQGKKKCKLFFCGDLGSLSFQYNVYVKEF